MSERPGLESASINVMGAGDIDPATITFISVPDYDYSWSGGIELGGSAGHSVGIRKSFESSWSVNGVFRSEFVSEWNIGDGEYYWYRVEGSCGEVRCDTSGILYPQCNNMTFMTVVAARNLNELCTTLSNPTMNPRVDFRLGSIKKYARPVFRDPAMDVCNELEDQEFCQIAECLEFCIDQDVKQTIPLFMRVIESIFIVDMTGGISLYGQVQTNRHKYYEPFFPTVGLTGSSECVLTLSHDASGTEAVSVSGSAESLSGHYSHFMAGGLEMSGYARTVSPGRIYSDMRGSLELTGSAKTCRGLSMGGSVSLSGSSENHFSMNFPFSGKIELGGRLLDYTSPAYFANWSGGVEVSGSAAYNFADYGFVVERFLIGMDAFDFASESSDTGYESVLTISEYSVNPSCGCSPVSMNLSLSHNLHRSKFISAFLNRAGLSMGDTVTMRYKTSDSSWRENVHFSGRGRDGVSLEDLSLSYILACSEGFWNFSFSATTSNRTTGDFLGTKFILDIPADLVCSDGNIATNIELNIAAGEFSVSTGESYFVTSPIPTKTKAGSRPLLPNPSARGVDVFVDGKFSDKRIYYDDIGLFKDSYWSRNALSMKINARKASMMPGLELSRIF